MEYSQRIQKNTGRSGRDRRNGKTTTANMISCILEGTFRTVSSRKSYNNHIGVPLSVLSIEDDTQVAVLELGANHKGEIGRLAAIAMPHAAVITNVGDSHIGYFGDYETLMNAKFELVDILPENGFLIYNADQEEVKRKALKYGGSLKTLGFGLECEAEMCVNVLESEKDSTIFEIEGFRFKINIPFDFNVYNAAAAIATAKVFGVDFETANRRLKEFKPILHRSYLTYAGGIEILDDSYNASPTAVKALFSGLLKIYPQKDIIAVIGEMRELGDYSRTMHEETGEYIAGLENIGYLLAGGAYAQDVISGAQKGRMPEDRMFIFEDKEEAARIIKKVAGDNSLVVIKASRIERFEDIIKYI